MKIAWRQVLGINPTNVTNSHVIVEKSFAWQWFGFDMKKYRKAEYVQRRVCFVNVQSSLHNNVVFSVCVHMGNATYFICIMWNSISGFV